MLSEDIIEHWGTWPIFHTNTDKATVNYESPFLILLHDEIAYKTLFGEEFAVEAPPNGDGEEEEKELYPIKYFAERLPVDSKDADEHYETIFELFSILSETEQMSYFRCGFIQRLVDFMWDSQLVKFYNVVSSMYIAAYLSILMASVALRWAESHPYMSSVVRTCLLVVNLVNLSLSLGAFEIKSLINDGFDYFTSFFNQNDMMLFALSVACLVQEVINMKKNKDVPNPEPVDTEADDYEFAPLTFYTYDSRMSYMRVSYSVLVVVVHIKILNVLSFYASIAFLVKMMEKIINEIGSFAAFFGCVLGTFCLCNNSLGMIWFNGDALWETGDYIGFGGMPMAFFITSLRNSMGDIVVNTNQWLPVPQAIMSWFVWLIIILLAVMVLMNLIIQLIEGNYVAVKDGRIEEAYQKKCAVLCELHEVFGKIAKRKPINILLTREWVNEPDFN